MRGKKGSTENAIDKEYQLQLFVIGNSPNSVRAINNLTAICEEYLTNSYTLEVIDVYQQPSIAKDKQIIALPLLIKKSPSPEMKLIGDMSVTLKVLSGLGIAPNENSDDK